MDSPTTHESELRAFETAVTLGDYLRVVVRRKWAVVIIFVTTVTLAALVSLRMPKVYQTSVTIKISQRITSQNLLSTFYFDPYFLETEIEMIRSRALMTTVANRLKLTASVASASPGLGEAVTELKITDGTPAGDLRVAFTGPATFAVTFDEKPVGEGRVGETCDTEVGSFVVRAERARAGDFIQLRVANTDAVVGFIMASVTVRPIENVNMVRVLVKGRDPARVAELADAVADAYVDFSLTEKRLQATSTRIFIEDQIDRTAKNLRDAEVALENFKRETGIVNMPAESQHYVDAIASLESELLKASIDRRVDAVELEMLKGRRDRAGTAAGLPTNEMLISHFAAGSALANLENRILELERKKSELLLTRTPDHPSMKALDAEITAANNQLDAALNDVLERGDLATNVSLADEKRGAMESNIRHYRELAATLPQKEMELNRLTRAYQVNEQVYTMLLEKLQEAKINEAMETADIAVVDYASVPKTPISPNYAKNILVGILLGAFLGVGVAYALEFSDTSLNSVEEVERRLERAVVGIIPRIATGAVERLVTHAGPYETYFISHLYPKSPVAEAYRTLRTAILASGVDVEVKKVLITSTGLSEGKTNTSVNLAITFAQAGNRVVLVDCDLRRSTIHRAFETSRTPGLADVIMGQAELAAAQRPTNIENLTLVPSGAVPPNPAELLGSKKFEAAIKELDRSFDRVVLDAPPVLAVTDALVLTRLTDGTCFVVCAGRTDRNAARRALYLLERTGSRILGVVLNQVDVARVYGSYGYKYYHQYYKSYMDKEVGA